MGVGESILGLLGNGDPRQRLIESIVGQAGGQPTGGAPYAAAGPGGAAATGPDASATSTPMPDGLKSPPDLASMYGDLMKYQSRTANIDRGFGLIGSSISQDGNREATLRAFTGDNGSGGVSTNPTDIANLALTLNKNKQAQMIRAAQLAALPAIAKRYGLDLDTATMMFNSGGLDEIIKAAEKPDRVTQAGANGQLLTIDQRQGAQIGAPVGPEKPRETINYQDANGQQVVADKATGAPISTNGPLAKTNDERLYDAAFDDYRARGGKPDEFPPLDTWMKDRQTRGAPQTKIDMKAESAEASKIGGYWGDQYTKVQDAGKAANDTLNNYDLIEKGLQTDVTTGALGESELALRKLGAYLGVDTDPTKVAGGELIQKVGNKMALLMRNPESGMGMPGSLSDKDLAFLKDSQIGLSTSGPGNKLALEVFRRMEQRKIDMAAAADDWIEDDKKGNGSMKGFTKYWRDWSKSRPLFDDIKVDDYVKKPADPGIQSLVDKYKSRK